MQPLAYNIHSNIDVGSINNKHIYVKVFGQVIINNVVCPKQVFVEYISYFAFKIDDLCDRIYELV